MKPTSLLTRSPNSLAIILVVAALFLTVIVGLLLMVGAFLGAVTFPSQLKDGIPASALLLPILLLLLAILILLIILLWCCCRCGKTAQPPDAQRLLALLPLLPILSEIPKLLRATAMALHEGGNGLSLIVDNMSSGAASAGKKLADLPGEPFSIDMPGWLKDLAPPHSPTSLTLDTGMTNFLHEAGAALKANETNIQNARDILYAAGRDIGRLAKALDPNHAPPAAVLNPTPSIDLSTIL